MDPIPENIDKLLPAKLLEDLYSDGVSDSAKEISKIGVDVIKTARLFLAPFQIAATFQDRFENFVRRLRTEIPKERLISAPPEVAGPALNQMKYLEEDNPLWKMFETLLRCSVDKDRVDRVHPSFAHIISQLARDEGMILYHLRIRDFTVVDTLDFIRSERRFVNLNIEQSDIPSDELFIPDKLHLYYSHLESLSLVRWPIKKQVPIKNENGEQTGVRRYSTMMLTEFGRLFVSACVPEEGFYL